MARPVNIQRQDILDVAFELFLAKGIHNTEMKDIASQCNVSRSSLYRYFENKEALVRTLLDEVLYRIYGNISFFIIDQDTGFQNLERILTIFVHSLESHIPLIRFLDDYDAYFPDRIFRETEIGFRIFPANKEPHCIHLALEKGVRDGSIQLINSIDFTSAFCINSLLAIAQRVLPRCDILRQEQGFAQEYLVTQLDIILKILQP